LKARSLGEWGFPRLSVRMSDCHPASGDLSGFEERVFFWNPSFLQKLSSIPSLFSRKHVGQY